MTTKLFKSIADGSMWINVPTAEREEGTNFYKKKRVNIEAVDPKIADALWTKTASGKTLQVDIDLENFTIVEEEVKWAVDAVVTSKGTVLSPARDGVKTLYKLVVKE